MPLVTKLQDSGHHGQNKHQDPKSSHIFIWFIY